MSARKDWVWMPHPGHLIISRDCRFHLNTCVGNYIVSTVGEYLPDSQVREIMANSKGVVLEGRGDTRLADFMKKIGYENIGFNRKYETMVFPASPAPKGRLNDCCPFRLESGREVDMAGYNDPGEAYRGHLMMCRKWAARPVFKEPPKEEFL